MLKIEDYPRKTVFVCESDEYTPYVLPSQFNSLLELKEKLFSMFFHKNVDDVLSHFNNCNEIAKKEFLDKLFYNKFSFYCVNLHPDEEIVFYYDHEDIDLNSCNEPIGIMQKFRVEKKDKSLFSSVKKCFIN